MKTMINYTRLTKTIMIALRSLALVGLLSLAACDSFVEVDPPKNLLVRETVFNDPETVTSALAHIYDRLRDQGMLSGDRGLSPFMGMYADELDYLGTNLEFSQLYQHTPSPTNTLLADWWIAAYHAIYAANDILEGVTESSQLTASEKAPLLGQAYFIRAFLHQLLVEVYGEVPYITTTNYKTNNRAVKQSREAIYTMVEEDLQQAISLLNVREAGSERTRPDLSTAQALLARVYLYQENWEGAALLATELINTSGYALEEELSQVFLKESSEAIWQFKPDEVNIHNTIEANTFVITSGASQEYRLSEALLSAFETGDERKAQWVGSFTNPDTGNTFYFPYKYRERFSTTASLEYSIVFRLAEQYLIRAEARAHLGQLATAREDLNQIRQRAGLPNHTMTEVNALLEAIIHERRLELFTEFGHRWFDLKRTQQAGAVLAPLKPQWEETDTILPIPESELELNPNLLPQNPGY